MSEPSQLFTPDLLIKILSGKSDITQEDKPKVLRYAIYARKSREEDDRQVRSITDQVSECLKLADQNGLNVVAQFLEAVSAKESGNREQFDLMMEKFKKGEIDGLLAWHPDRLARNMLEAGMVIDYLDHDLIKSLIFVSFTYENSTMGKVMLALAFAMSKQYSDKLSEDVRRGTRRIAEEGKRINRTKPGYFKDSERYLRPDGRNYELIKDAFNQRLEGKGYLEICKYLTDQGFTVRDKENSEPKKIRINKTKLSRILRDPVYAGVLKTGDSRIDLCSRYDFVPAISISDFLKINKYDDLEKVFRQRKTIPGQKSETSLMRKMVVCGYCNQNFTASITHKHSKSGKESWYYYFLCDTPGCKFNHKSVRAKVIIDFVLEFLKGLKYDNPKLYTSYKEELGKVNKMAQENLKGEKGQINRSLIQSNDKIAEIKEYLVESTDKAVQSIFEGDLKDELVKVKGLKDRLKEIEARMKTGETLPVTHEQFIKLLNELPDEIAKTQGMEQLDYKIRKIFSNFTVKDNKVLMYSLQSPFKEFLENGIISQCRGERTRTSDPCVPNAVL